MNVQKVVAVLLLCGLTPSLCSPIASQDRGSAGNSYAENEGANDLTGTSIQKVASNMNSVQLQHAQNFINHDETSNRNTRLESMSPMNSEKVQELNFLSPIGKMVKRNGNGNWIDEQNLNRMNNGKIDPVQSPELMQEDEPYNDTQVLENQETGEEVKNEDGHGVGENYNMDGMAAEEGVANETVIENLSENEKDLVDANGQEVGTNTATGQERIKNDHLPSGQNESYVLQNFNQSTEVEIDHQMGNLSFNAPEEVVVTEPPMIHRGTESLVRVPGESNEHEENVVKATTPPLEARSSSRSTSRVNDLMPDGEHGAVDGTGHEENIKGFGTESINAETAESARFEVTVRSLSTVVTESNQGNVEKVETNGTNTEAEIPLPNINSGEGTFVEPGTGGENTGEKDKPFPDMENGGANETNSNEPGTSENQEHGEENTPHESEELLPSSSSRRPNSEHRVTNILPPDIVVTEPQENTQRKLTHNTETPKVVTDGQTEQEVTEHRNIDHEGGVEITTKYSVDFDHVTEEVIGGPVTEETIPKNPGGINPDSVIIQPSSTSELVIAHVNFPSVSNENIRPTLSSILPVDGPETEKLFRSAELKTTCTISQSKSLYSSDIQIDESVASLALSSLSSPVPHDSILVQSSKLLSPAYGKGDFSNLLSTNSISPSQSSVLNTFQSTEVKRRDDSMTAHHFQSSRTSEVLASAEPEFRASSHFPVNTKETASVIPVSMATEKSVIVTLPSTSISVSLEPLSSASVLKSTPSDGVPHISMQTDLKPTYIPEPSSIPNVLQTQNASRVHQSEALTSKSIDVTSLGIDSSHYVTSPASTLFSSHVTLTKISPSPSIAFLPHVSHGLVVNDTDIIPKVSTTNRNQRTTRTTDTTQNPQLSSTPKVVTHNDTGGSTARSTTLSVLFPFTSGLTVTRFLWSTKKESDNSETTKKPLKNPKDPEKVTVFSRPWSSTEKGEYVTAKPALVEPHVFIQIQLKMTWTEFCRKRVQFLVELQQIIQEKLKRKVEMDQIKIIFNTTDFCELLKDNESKGEVTVRIYIIDNNGQFDEKLTICFSGYILSGFHSLKDSQFGEKVEGVHLVNPTTENVVTSTSKKSQLGSGITVAITIASVGGFCCVCLLILQIIIHKRQGRRMSSFVPSSCRQSFRSMDSIALGAVTKSRPHSGLWNPGLEHDEVESSAPSHLLGYTSLANFTMDTEGIYDEFEKLPYQMPSLTSVPVGAEDKNRFANVIPIPATRVRLKKIPEEDHSDYINANYVTGYKKNARAYIATQAPMSNTVSDFWRMVWEQQSRVILMLSTMDERGQPRGTTYLPEIEGMNGRLQHGDYMIVLKKKEVHQEYIVSILQLKDIENNLLREIKHFWYTCWSKDSLPEPISLVKFILDTRLHYEDSGAPVIVHCSPGTGRTGTVIATDICMRSYEGRRMVDILNCVHNMRQERAGSVQTREQYALIYKAVFEYAVVMSSPTISNTSSTFQHML